MLGAVMVCVAIEHIDTKKWKDHAMGRLAPIRR